MLKFVTKKSFFTKLMVTNLVIIFFTLSILGVLLGQLYQSYFYNEIESNLKNQGIEVNNLVLSYLNGDLSYSRLQGQLTSISRISKSEIWVVDKDGLVYEASGSSRSNIQGSRLDKAQYKQILEGKNVRNISKDQYHFASSMMSVGVPLIIDNHVEGATLLHTPILGIQSSIIQVYWRIVIAALISIFVAFLLTYYLSRRLSEPIHEMTRVSLAMAKGDFSKEVSTITDDEIGRLASTFNFMVSELGKLEQTRMDFIANVSHELRSPLTSVRGFIQGVLDGTIPPEDQKKYLGIAYDETKRLSRLVNDLLELARMEAGNLNLNIQPFNLHNLLVKVATKMEPQASEKEIDISLLGLNNLTVLADQDKIEQIIINLLDNAIRFTHHKGQINLTVQKERDRASISVIDNGVGIPKEEIEQIWERFYKCDKARTRYKGGTGLGLAIIKHLIKAHGEDITVESEQGQGTKFTFTLPVKK